MDREVVWTLRALQDVEAVADYVAGDSPGYAASLSPAWCTQPAPWPRPATTEISFQPCHRGQA